MHWAGFSELSCQEFIMLPSVEFANRQSLGTARNEDLRLCDIGGKAWVAVENGAFAPVVMAFVR